MSKTIIEVKCIDQVLTLTNTPVIASGGVGEDFVRFDLCDKWDGFAVSAIFWRKGVDCIPVLLDAENSCQVPPELMTSEGIVYFGVAGVAPDGTTRTSESVSYLIQEGTITENTALPIPGEDVFKQLMSCYADVKLYVGGRVDQLAAAAEKAAGAVLDMQEALEHTDIYPGVVQAVLNEGSNNMKIPLAVRPSEKMFLTFRAPFNDGTVESLSFATVKIAYTDETGTTVEELFWVRDGYQSAPPDESVQFGYVVTVLLVRSSRNEIFVLNPSITNMVKKQLDAKAEKVTFAATVGTSWTAYGGYYYQDIVVEGIQATDEPDVDVAPEDDNAANVVHDENICKVFRVTTSDGSIRVWAKEKITTALPIRLKVVR